MLIPALDLINNEVVRLYQGDYNQKTIYKVSALEQAKVYAIEGIQWLHLVDLDGAKDPACRQFDLIKKIRAQTHLNIQYGGGIRTLEDVKTIFDFGVNRVVIGTSSVTNPDFVKELFQIYGSEKIVLALDVNIDAGTPFVATHGWQESSKIPLSDLIDLYTPCGLIHVLCTDIAKDGTLTGLNIDLYEHIFKHYPHIKLQASGGVASLEDIVKANLSKAVHSTIIGKALLEQKFTLQEALNAC